MAKVKEAKAMTFTWECTNAKGTTVKGEKQQPALMWLNRNCANRDLPQKKARSRKNPGDC